MKILSKSIQKADQADEDILDAIGLGKYKFKPYKASEKASSTGLHQHAALCSCRARKWFDREMQLETWCMYWLVMHDTPAHKLVLA